MCSERWPTVRDGSQLLPALVCPFVVCSRLVVLLTLLIAGFVQLLACSLLIRTIWRAFAGWEAWGIPLGGTLCTDGYGSRRGY